MLSKPQLLKFISKVSPQTITNLRFLGSNKLLCTLTESAPITDSPESPNLPSWLQNPKTLTEDPDDDFVIPSYLSWVNTQNPIASHSKNAKNLSKNSIDIEKISEILKKGHESHDSVVASLHGCGVDLSTDLVFQVLKRFSNEWIPAFGFFTWAKTQTGYVHSSDLCDTMVDVLGKSKQFNVMWNLVHEMENSSGFITLHTMSKVIRRLARAGDYSDAIDAFRQLEKFGVKKDTAALNVLMDALVKEGSVEHANEVFLEFKSSIPINTRILNVLIHGYCKARKFEEAWKIANDTVKEHDLCLDVVSYTSFIEAYCREKDFRRVFSILEEMKEKSCNPNIITYTVVMHGLGKAKHIDQALGIYEKMKLDKCLPDTSFYNSLIFILSKAGRFKDATEVFNDMSKQGVERDVSSYNTMISSACKLSQEEMALKLLMKMDEEGCEPNIETYSALLKLCCKKKRMKVLAFLLHHMFKNNVSIDLGTYALLVRGLCKSGKIEQACLFFEETVRKGMVPKDSMYKILTSELEGKGMIEMKGKIERLMPQTSA